MLPSNFKPNGLFDLVRLGGDHDGGYLIEKTSIEQSHSLLSMGIGKNWKFEKDFIACKPLQIHAYDHTVTGVFWVKFFTKRFLSVLMGRVSAPLEAVKTFNSFNRFFQNKALHIKEQIGYEKSGHTNLKISIERLEHKPIFLKVDIEGSEYEILAEVISLSENLSGMAIEFHKVSEHTDEIESFIEKFDLQLVHTHPNNNRLGDQGDPEAIEMTFARDPTRLNEESLLPHPLDLDNVPRKKSVDLSFSG